ncbi:MAG: hypothetical protein AAGH76_01545 [Pseudomonadota bacterium]
MSLLRVFSLLALTGFVGTAIGSAPIAHADGVREFMRIDVDAQRTPRALQVAVRRYRRDDDTQSAFVDLIGVVHVGNRDYYRELNASFRQYDALLYELVAPKNHGSVSNREKSGGLLSGAQIAMKDMLGLEFQLDHIDYEADNFVHADLSPSALRASMNERGESLYVYFWRAIYAGMSDYAKDPLGLRSWQLLGAMAAPDDEAGLRRAFAEELLRSDAMLDSFGGENGSALIEARNEEAMRVFDDVWQGGEHRVGIFYGAAHMPDFAERLEARGFVETDSRWLDAWLLTDDE